VGAQWQLYSVDVKTGADKFLAPIDLPASTDGKRVLISIAKWPFDIWMIDIWMMEGFDQPASRTCGVGVTWSVGVASSGSAAEYLLGYWKLGYWKRVRQAVG